MKVNIYFRADGNSKIGMGHVIRSLALAEMLSLQFDCHFIIRAPTPALKIQILYVCQSIIELSPPKNDLQEAEKLANTTFTNKDIVVLDGYNFSTNYQKIIKHKGCKLVCIDDIHAYHFVADAIINHAGNISTNQYSGAPYTEYYLGLKYALLRSPFLAAAKNRQASVSSKNIFICLGGADPKNDTLQVLKKCETVSGLNKCYLVIGSAYSHRKSLIQYLEKTTLDIELLENLSAKEMVSYMQLCGIGITPPSTVSYEYLCTGGLLYLKVIASNQIDIHRYFLQAGLAYDFENSFPLAQNENLSSYLDNQVSIFDGMQPKRFLRLFKYLQLGFRMATKEDCSMYFDWTNETETRRQSFNSAPIPFPQHKEWFYQKLEQSNCFLYVIELDGHPIGQIRFVAEKEATISYSLDKSYRGKGWGGLLLKKGVAIFQQETKNKYPIIGFVKKDNPASAQAFRNLNFKEETTKDIIPSYKYTLI